jgi:hypothetical protein
MRPRKPAGMTEVRTFDLLGGLTVSVDEIRGMVAAGAQLELEESRFDDDGNDYCRLVLNGKVIGHLNGY